MVRAHARGNCVLVKVEDSISRHAETATTTRVTLNSADIEGGATCSDRHLSTVGRGRFSGPPETLNVLGGGLPLSFV